YRRSTPFGPRGVSASPAAAVGLMTDREENRASEALSGRGGRCFEDFRVGDVYRHWPGRTITAADNRWFTFLTQNTNPLHFDEVYAARTPFGRILVNSAFTLALVTGLTVADVSHNPFATLPSVTVPLPLPP